MRKTRNDLDEVLPEYNFSRSRPNKYASRYAKCRRVATIDPGVADIRPAASEAHDHLAGPRKHHPEP